jgi:hypothetical protein
MKQIATAFIKAKHAFGPVLKDKNNPHFKSKYADLEACLSAVDDACLNAGIALYQETFESDSGVTVETVFLHESGESLRCGKLHVPAAKQDPQGYGSALTYARRYSLLTACGIAAEDDDGNAGVEAKKRAAETDASKRRAEWIEATAIALETCETIADLQAVWVPAFKKMTANNDPGAIETLTPIKDRVKAMLGAPA